MTAKRILLCLTKILESMNYYFTKCAYLHTKYIKLKTVRTFSPIFSNPLLTTVLNKRQLVRPLWRDNGKCGETFFLWWMFLFLGI